MTAKGHSIHIQSGCLARHDPTPRLTARVNPILRRCFQRGFTRVKRDTCLGEMTLAVTKKTMSYRFCWCQWATRAQTAFARVSREGASRAGARREGASRTGANRTGANRAGANRAGASPARTFYRRCHMIGRGGACSLCCKRRR